MIKAGLWLYLNVTFSLKEAFRIDGVCPQRAAEWAARPSVPFICSRVAVSSVQVTAALMLTAQFLHTPGGSFRSTWPNIQVRPPWSEQEDVGLTPVFLRAAAFTCRTCEKVFKKVDLLRRHKRIHASQKPALVCPRDDCQAYFSTTFNLQHHIRKAHLNLLKYKCPFPECPRVFAMRVSERSRMHLFFFFFNCRSVKVLWFVLTGEPEQTPASS